MASLTEGRRRLRKVRGERQTGASEKSEKVRGTDVMGFTLYLTEGIAGSPDRINRIVKRTASYLMRDYL